MTEEGAAKLAEECGGENVNGELFYMTITQLAMFADSVQLDEGEACAALMEHLSLDGLSGKELANEIRKRCFSRPEGQGAGR
jgi:hypothetical protein